MAHDLMTRCDVKRLYKIGAKKEARWVEVAVADLPDGDEGNVRCTHCHGAVRIHRPKVLKGPEVHVRHRSRADSQTCQGGHSFQGTHQPSPRPVE